MNKSYHECIRLSSFEERYQYLKLTGAVGDMTFGGHRSLNQLLYRMPEWRRTRRDIIIRDNGCDLAHPDFELNQAAYIHHINPITIQDILDRNPIIFDPDNLIVCSFNTHQAIHYGDEGLLPKLPIERQPNDTCPWR